MFMIRVEFPNLTFGLEVDIGRVPNVKFIPLADRYLLAVSRSQMSHRCCADAASVCRPPAIHVLRT